MIHGPKNSKWLLACAGSLAMVPAYAQPASTDARVGGLEEVVVTARKRSENLQEVPVSISVISGADLDNKNIGDMRDLGQYIPNVDFAPPPS